MNFDLSLFTNIMGDKLLLIVWREISALIYNFTCEITKMLWQRFLYLYLSAKMASRFKDVTDEEVTALKDAAKNLNTRKSTINSSRLAETVAIFYLFGIILSEQANATTCP